MLTNTADGIVNWLKENKRGLTLKFCNRGTASGNNLLCNNWTIYIQEEANTFLYEIAEIQENKLKIWPKKWAIKLKRQMQILTPIKLREILEFLSLPASFPTTFLSTGICSISFPKNC